MELFDNGALHRPSAVRQAILGLSETSETDRGAVFTRPAVVGAVLDLAGYTPDRDLAALRILEPSFGGGDFLLPVVSRLLASYKRIHASFSEVVRDLGGAVVGVEVHRESYEHTGRKLMEVLVHAGVAPGDAEALLAQWLLLDDFLLADLPGSFDLVVGNPPYVRHERIADVLLREYKTRYKTIYDRADLYVPFIERGLDLLGPDGALAFICANRWVKNRYGKKLRAKVAAGFHLAHYVDMEGTEAFTSDVIAYTAITVIVRGKGVRTRIARSPEVSDSSLQVLVRQMLSPEPHDSRVDEVERVVSGDDPWLLDSAEQLGIVRRLEAEFPVLEEAGCKVGIGVATGCDRVFIGPYDELPVEPERKLPLAMAADLGDDGIRWGGKGIVNPWLEGGTLASFEDAPRFAAYLKQHATALKRRHTAKAAPAKWYKTIDRIYPLMVTTPKLLIPDIKGTATVVFDKGNYYPHHNLYWITSPTWDLRALQAVLRSSIALMFVAAYCVRMSGGFLRFQAQYLRRIRVPHWNAIPAETRARLARVGTSTNQDDIDTVVFPLYGLSRREAEVARRLAEQARVRSKT